MVFRCRVRLADHLIVTFKLTSIVALCLLFFSSVSAQHRKLTVVLVRHAEKDVSATADKVNPVLAPEGKLRAERLIKAVRRYKFDAVYSSDFVRTRETAAPLAAKRGIGVQIYDHKDLNKMVELIMSGKIKRLLVVGHNSTTPALTNLLLGIDKYKPLSETEYDKIFVVRIRKYKRKPVRVADRQLTY
jgi:broad specificity phosphatase PhoE